MPSVIGGPGGCFAFGAMSKATLDLSLRQSSLSPPLQRGSGMEYAVKAETHEGKVLILKRGFASQEEAEDHPVRMSHWKRVWVEAIQPP